MADIEDIDREDGTPPDREPKSSKVWLAAITGAQKDMRDYQDRADNIDKRYANLERMASITRDREFQMFWANIQVLGPSVYSRPPVPVVVPRFRDRRPLYRTASEILERSVGVAFDLEDMDSVMRLVRDDLTIVARGVIWARYEKKDSDGPERVCIEHVDRKDFLHPSARNWKEVGWVARRAWMTRTAMRKRFSDMSGIAYRDAAFEVRKDDADMSDGLRKAAVWEIWSKDDNRVVWVSEGCDKLLDDDKPHLELEGFYPCPRPAYATVQRGTLVPVPDFLQYKDQLEEINELTGRIAVLTEGIKLRGFYPAGSGEVADAIEAAMKSISDNLLVPITNMSSLGGNGSFKDMIIWLPIDQMTTTVRELTDIRRQLIDDVYQITGLSDIMRGATTASETLGAQQLKSQYGSIRIRDRQDELVRLARDTTRIVAEIMAENFSGKTLTDMAQFEIESDADVTKRLKPMKKQRDDLMEQAKLATSDPEMMQRAQAEPEKAQQVIEQVKGQLGMIEKDIGEAEEAPTLEKVMKLLRDQRLRPFALDIETDSTITPDENAQKQRATEYVTAMSGMLAQVGPAIQQFPPLAPLMGDVIKFVQSQFRVGRDMDQTVDELTEKMKELAQQPPPDQNAGAAQAAQADAQMKAGEMQMRQQELQMKGQIAQADAQAKMQLAQVDAVAKQQDMAVKAQIAQQDAAAREAETQAKMAEIGAKQASDAQRHEQEMRKGDIDLQIKSIDLQIKEVALAQAMAPKPDPEVVV